MFRANKLEVKSIVKPDSVPPQCDFVLPGRNTVLTTKNCNFDFTELQKQIGFSSMTFDLDTYTPNRGCSWPTPWARDFITCKTAEYVYTLNHTISVSTTDAAIVTQNSNIAPSILENKEYLFKFNKNFIKCKPTDVISAGGNMIQCVNAERKSYAIVGEAGLTSQFVTDAINDWQTIKKHGNLKTESKSKNKYPVNDADSNDLAMRRELSKEMLKSQLGNNTALVVVPNLEWHIDVVMAVLPNGVVLLHSFDETLKLLEKHKEDISKGCDLSFDEIYEKTKELAEKSKHLLAETKRKLEKRNFIVKEICGLMSKTGKLNDVFACGLNSMVGVTQAGEIFYTLLSDNPKWYLEYMKQELQECGVTHYPCISNPRSLEILRKSHGSVRCQYNTIPNQAFFSHSKKRSVNDSELKIETNHTSITATEITAKTNPLKPSGVSSERVESSIEEKSSSSHENELGTLSIMEIFKQELGCYITLRELIAVSGSQYKTILGGILGMSADDKLIAARKLLSRLNNDKSPKTKPMTSTDMDALGTGDLWEVVKKYKSCWPGEFAKLKNDSDFHAYKTFRMM